jgi:hypothetical protein
MVDLGRMAAFGMDSLAVVGRWVPVGKLDSLQAESNTGLDEMNDGLFEVSQSEGEE